ncbi:serine protease inhibitor 42Dd-like [Drosophila novamexicana]|uniref:serine protease inhibitor 42Dd-like n=1 Tax=Drosophila novamexicana TaxID=47314 RepID=UPI0011E58A36|nr:serine protease inhibitor 42Dd-like [Drosophila novamexicana]
MVKVYRPVLVQLALIVFFVGLTFGFMRELQNEYPSDNFIISPFLLAEGLSLLYLGAHGESANELKSVIPKFLANKETDIDAYLSEDRGALKSSEEGILRFGNRLYVTNDMDILIKYEKKIKKVFNTNVNRVDFSDPKSVNVINRWVAQITNNKITKLIDKFNGNEKIILASAIHFNGLWQFPFDETLTEKAPFYVPKEGETTKVVKVDMMNRVSFFLRKFVKELDADAISLPYANSNITMVVLLPRTMDGIGKLLDHLSEVNINDILRTSELNRLHLHLPKFQFEFKITLNDILKSIGLSNIFNEANLKLMTDFKSQLKVAEIVQKSVITVDERGTKAAAAQEISAALRGFLEHLEFNHPFVFYIIDEERIYFVGQVRNPLLK